MSPRCTSWLGHKFEGRYSFAATSDVKIGPMRGSGIQFEDMIRAFQDKTYERDICVRCGATIEKQPPPNQH